MYKNYSNTQRGNKQVVSSGLNSTSVMSYPSRGNWGDFSYRGNCSGHVIKDMVEFFKPKLFVDACEGSGTSGDVCKEMGIDYVGLDLRHGNDFTKHSILDQLPRPADICFTHPPYHDMIKYSGEMYENILIEDTSRAESYEDFLAKSQVMLLNQREATIENGVYATLIGDYKKKGVFHSIQSDFIQMMPKDELFNVVIKLQHNCFTNSKKYNGNAFIPIMHEYLLLWKKKSKTLFQVSFDMASNFQKQVATTWRSVIRIVMMKHKTAPLNIIYKEVEKVAAHLIEKNQNWQAKIRQILQKHYTNVSRGVWAV